MKTLQLFLLVGLISLTLACNKDNLEQMIQKPIDFRSTASPEWAKNAAIYEVNIRQYTPEGTFQAFAAHLPRLKDMGVKIVWLMPIYPISEVQKKGALGSYYAVADYRGVNPAFGTMQDFKKLVQQIHALDMRIILDWVPNHTGWDHAWLKDNPDYYTTDVEGSIISPIDRKTGKSFGWTDIAQLDYNNPQLRQAMIEDMLFWLEETGIDGYRCDMAAQVPDYFWIEALAYLRKAKPDLFLLAESEHSPHRNLELFAASYGWSFHKLLNDIAQGKKNATAIDRWHKEDQLTYIAGYHLHFITNHDENSHNGSEYERMGDAVEAMAVLVGTFEGMPLLYNGQEAALDRPLAFFEKDMIAWNDYPKQSFYQKLLQLKAENPALWNGIDGGAVQRILTDNANVYAFLREKDGNKVVVVVNLSPHEQEVMVEHEQMAGGYKDVFDDSYTSVPKAFSLELAPWGYLVLSNHRD